ncbi:MAG: ABC transporter permease [Hydrococcus sp. Prado102]|nr:ABC transporter permease [Hydrococcus sp. Prado102]
MSLYNQTDEPVPEIVYSSESRLKQPVQLLKEMGRDLWGSRELAWRLFIRDIQTRYRKSLLGPLWTFLPAIITALTLTFLQDTGVLNLGKTDIPYPFYVMFGQVLWDFFVTSLNLPLRAVKMGMSLLKTIKMPVESLILSRIGEMFFDLGIQFIILMILFVIFRIPLTWSVWLAPLAILMLMLLGIGLGLLLVPIGSLYTDVLSSLPLITRLWFFLTPVIYPPPQKWPYSLMVDLNPVSPLLTGARDLVARGGLTQPSAFIAVSLITLLLVVVGWILYRLSIPILVEKG